MSEKFLGLPINGDKVTGAARNEQYPIEDFAPILMAVLNDTRVNGIRFTQYTPYFNDGNPCIFGVNEPRFDLTIINEDCESSYYDDYCDLYDLEPVIGDYEYSYDKRGGRSQSQYIGPDQEFYDSLKALSEALTGGHFNDVLLEAFGDHAEVTITRNGIDIEFYEND